MPRFRKCSHCGETFQVPIMYCDGKPTKYSGKKNCSAECTNSQRAKAIDYKSSDRIAKLSDAGKKKECYERIHTSESREKAQCSIRKLADQYSESRVNVLQSGKAALGNDSRGRRITFVAPSGEYFKTWNIAHFVRENENLFLPEDIEWKVRARKNQLRQGATTGQKYCKAVNGLQHLARGDNQTWKGWTLLSNTTLSLNLVTTKP